MNSRFVKQKKPAVLAVVLVAALLSACAPREDSADNGNTWVGTVTTDGDVTTVVNESGSVWGGDAALVEEMSIGVDVGEDEYMLGHIWNVYATDERVYLTDGQTPAVRVYDTDGRYVSTIGDGPGEGPGEYQSPIMVSAAADGTTFVYDGRLHRLTTYDPEGEPIDSWAVESGACCAWRMSVAADGTLWMPIEQPAFLSPTGETRYGAQPYVPADGPGHEIRWHPQIDFEADTIQARGVPMRVPFSPNYSWTLTADGGVTVGASDRYRFEQQRIDGTTLVVERHVDPVPVQPAEAEWHRRWTLHNIRNYIEPDFDASMDIPDRKPVFVGFAPDAHGGTWVWRSGPSRHLGGDCVDNPFDTDVVTARDNSCWESDRFFDIFGPDGRYLGSVPQPDGLARWNAQLNLFPMGDVVYAIIETAEGIPTVKRYRLVLPGEE